MGISWACKGVLTGTAATLLLAGLITTVRRCFTQGRRDLIDSAPL